MSIKAAAENLYYRRDYSAAMELAMLALRGSAADSVHGLEKKELVVLVEACRRRFASLRTV